MSQALIFGIPGVYSFFMLSVFLRISKYQSDDLASAEIQSDCLLARILKSRDNTVRKNLASNFRHVEMHRNFVLQPTRIS
jgi:hypothetical protein